MCFFLFGGRNLRQPVKMMSPPPKVPENGPKNLVGAQFFWTCKNVWGLNMREQKEDCNMAKLGNLYVYAM